MSWIDRIRDRLFGFGGAGLPKAQPAESRVYEIHPQVLSGFPERVLFVCSGNICRSAYGEYRFRQLAAASHPDTRVMSAGTLRIVGREAAPCMMAAAAARGLDLTPHRSNGLSRLLVDTADVIFTMENVHRDALVQLSPCAQKIVMLGLWLDTPQPEIEDPMGKSPDVYERVADQLDEALRNWFAHYS